jgi:hypothetical protein
MGSNKFEVTHFVVCPDLMDEMNNSSTFDTTKLLYSEHSYMF